MHNVRRLFFLIRALVVLKLTFATQSVTPLEATGDLRLHVKEAIPASHESPSLVDTRTAGFRGQRSPALETVLRDVSPVEMVTFNSTGSRTDKVETVAEVTKAEIKAELPGTPEELRLSGATGSRTLLSTATSTGAYTVGSNSIGQLGDGTVTSRTTPVHVMSEYTVSSAAAGYEYTIFITSDGQAFATGGNGYGQLGDGTTTSTSTPIQVMSAYIVSKVTTAHGHHTVFITSSGQAFATGSNDYGQLGDGTTTSTSTPIQVMSGYSIANAVAGNGHTVFITSNGQVFATGANGDGRLGDGTRTSRSTPVQVMSGHIVSSAAIGGSFSGLGHTIFITSDGQAYATGNNNYGQLGSGCCATATTPLRVMSAYTISSAAAGGYFGNTVFITSDGAAYAVGENLAGQLGDGTTEIKYTPVRVMSAYTVSSATLGYHHSVYLTSDGRAFGSGNYPEYYGGAYASTTPIQVMNGYDIMSVEAGEYHTCFLPRALSPPPPSPPPGIIPKVIMNTNQHGKCCKWYKACAPSKTKFKCAKETLTACAAQAASSWNSKCKACMMCEEADNALKLNAAKLVSTSSKGDAREACLVPTKIQSSRQSSLYNKTLVYTVCSEVRYDCASYLDNNNNCRRYIPSANQKIYRLVGRKWIYE